MSGATMAHAPGGVEAPARRRLRQVGAVARLTARRVLTRSWGMYLLALLPVALFSVRATVILVFGGEETVADSTRELAEVYQPLVLALAVFFGCVAVFGNLFRREILERTLHLYFLSPLARPVLLAGKYLGGLAAAGTVFTTATAAAFVLAYLPAGGDAFVAFLRHGPGLEHLAAYLGVTLLAVAGYGAVFLTLGLFFRNPAFPAIALFGWESINFLLPPALKKASMIHHLRSLCPVPVSEGPFALLSDSPSPAAAILSLAVLAAALLALSAWKVSRMEVLYGEE